MNYQLIYNNLIESRFSLKRDRSIQKSKGNYFELHHIIPKNKGGSNGDNNLVYLTAREHFIAHKLLWLINKDRSSALALHKMTSSTRYLKRIISSRDYEFAREAFRLTNLGNTYGKGNKGRKGNLESHRKLSEILKIKFLGEGNPFYNKYHTNESKEKIRQSKLGISPTENTRKILSEKASLRKGDTSSRYKGKRIVLRNGIIQKQFNSNKEVAEYLEIKIHQVKALLSRPETFYKGFNLIYSKI